jgi:hypothetical protein
VEKRRSKRIIITLLAELILEREIYVGAIENLSEYGINVRIFPLQAKTEFIPGTSLDLELLSFSGEKLQVQCEIKWVHIYKEPSQGLITSMGMEIIDAHPRYQEFLKTLR